MEMSDVFKFTLYAIKNLRAPTTVTPAVRMNFGFADIRVAIVIFLQLFAALECRGRTFSS